jgi:aminodeoxyfutalosine synthase
MIRAVADPCIQSPQSVKARNLTGACQPRISEDDGLELFRTENLTELQAIGTGIRARRFADQAFYIVNRHINYSNICILDCSFCAFGKRRRDAEAYELSIEEIAEQARAANAAGALEIHMVGGLHPTWKFEIYLSILRAIREAAPAVVIKAFTAIEIIHLTWMAKKPLEAVLEMLKEAGLGCLTGGGAEIFAPEIRSQICRGKESAEEWLHVHRLAHRLGIRSTATMLFGNLETFRHRVDHLRQLRDLQDETGGFLAFLPLPFKPAYRLSHLREPTEAETLKMIAVARAYLDNFEHIKAYWISFGLDTARRALGFGADDLDGTIEEERIYHMAGVDSPLKQTAEALRSTICQAGLRPRLRDAFYNVVE